MVARKSQPSRHSAHCPTIATNENMFTIFKKLPPELRNRVWSFAANNEPRTLDIWSDFLRCEIGGSVFFTQKYTTELARPKIPAILHTSRESRAEALKHYKLEFCTQMNLPSGIKVTFDARIYINYACDVLAPRGFWNIVSFADFTTRVSKRGLVYLALDTEGSFWAENLRDYCAHGNWKLNGVEELIIYDSGGEKFWKGMEYLDKFRKRYKGGPKLLVLEGLDGDESANVRDVETYLRKTFDKIEGKEEKIEDAGEGQESEQSTPAQRRKASYLKDSPVTEAEDLERPNITYRKLVAKSIDA
ncbi:hypothetical protein L207DRAFT_518411 [Hyaloscypha variabilis F]|uniref:2EXR domain-containing protein n=1 Tax=Hyaloscypha variabilis (strain UAMH 11265 / GT02V1 / F) TaxID=1149755 RepID=A0A2J6R3I5_HYAVF|nr:hypothetical protein L207DRAFT_518411 [Hyaloscypha variabilis F]